MSNPLQITVMRIDEMLAFANEHRELIEIYYNNFTPDDADYIVFGMNHGMVDTVANALKSCDFEMTLVGQITYAVTYH